MAKRLRDEDQLESLVQDLEAAALRTPEAKIKALKKVQEVINPADEQYSAQKELVAGGIATTLVELLDAEQPVAQESAATIAKIARQSEMTVMRIKQGNDLGLATNEVTFNPVQQDLADSGAISSLVSLVLSGSEDASEALEALCSYHRQNKMTYLLALVKELNGGNTQVLTLIDSVLGGLEVRDDAAVILDQALLTIVGITQTGSRADKLNAVTLLGTVVEQRPAIAEFLRAEGALQPIVQLLITGDLEAKDAAVHTLWLLTKGNRRALNPGCGLLGVEGTQLIDPLLEIIQEGQAQDSKVEPESQSDKQPEKATAVASEELQGEEVETADAETGEENGEVEEEQQEAAEDAEDAAAAANGAPEALETVISNKPDAEALLEALAAEDPEVRGQVKESKRSKKRCYIM